MDQPSTTRSLRFDSAGVDIGAHVRTPGVPGPWPGVVVVDGSGPSTRHDQGEWESVFRDAGFAVLSHDKPGCGDTSGDWTAQSLDDRVAESAAAVRALRDQPDVDGARVGLWGGSQGGWVVPGVAALDPQVAFAVVCSAPAVSPAEQEAYSLEQRMREDCAAPGDVAEALAYFHRRSQRLRRGDDPADVVADQERVDAGWMGYVTHGERETPEALGFLGRCLDHDPLPSLARLRCPLLAIWGERDPLVPVARSVALYCGALRHNPDVTLQVIPGADHGLRRTEAATGERRRAPGVLEGMARWAAHRASP